MHTNNNTMIIVLKTWVLPKMEAILITILIAPKMKAIKIVIKIKFNNQ